jgi:hypothetical protein
LPLRLPLPASWRYAAPADPSAGRDERLDLLRGLCLLKMVLTHLWPQPVDLQIAFGFVSAAEGFFLLSGATTGIVFGRRAEALGFATTARALARRGAQLYLWNLALVCIFFAAETTRLLPYDQFHRAEFTPLALLRFNQPYFLQMLPRYALFLVLAPLALAALRAGRTALLVALSCGTWAAVVLHGGRPRLPWIEEGGSGAFLVLSWQLLFFVGMALGFHRDRLGRLWRRLPAGVTSLLPAAGFLTFVAIGIAHANGTLGWEPSRVAALFGRDQLGPGRLLNLACAALFFFAVVDRLWKPIRAAFGWLLLPFGRHALYIFLAHVVTYGLGLALGPRLPFALYGHPDRLAVAGLLHLGLLWVLARWAPLRRWLAL